MRPLWPCLLAAVCLPCTLPRAFAQWEMQHSDTTVDLRGIESVGGGVAWASGTRGTVLRTEDGGYLWQGCTTPPGAGQLDFRGIQAFDENTAIVMSSGKGDLSRLYKTTDGCQSWKLLFTNPDQDGFWDSIVMADRQHGWLLGDPVHGSFVIGETHDGGSSFSGFGGESSQGNGGGEGGLEAGGRGAFAASNSSLAHRTPTPSSAPCALPLLYFGTSGPDGAVVLRAAGSPPGCASGARQWSRSVVPMAGGSSTAGVFSLALRDDRHLVAAGGDYRKPGSRQGTAAFSSDGGQHWQPAQTPPHGYRSAVAYDAASRAWIAVGPNGSDDSTDDGRNWRPLRPGPEDQPGSDRDWNALSLPFVVGPHGRIGKLRGDALPPVAKPTGVPARSRP